MPERSANYTAGPESPGRTSVAGRPLALAPGGRPLLGVKCGCNEAFVHDAADAALRDVEPALLRQPRIHHHTGRGAV